MAATKSAGRVSIRVLPDSTRFKEDLKKSLERIEKSTVVKIPVELELARDQLLKLKAQIEALRIKIRPTIDLNIDQTELDAMRARIESMRPTVDVGLNTSRAATRIAALTRTRELRIRPVLDNSAVRLFGAKLRALSGLNVVGDMFEQGKEFFLNIDRNAVKFAGLISKFGLMAAAIGSATQSLVMMGAQLVGMASIGWLAPAFMTGAAIGVGVLTAALKDTGTVLADLKPKFAAWQDSISADFWREAAKPIRELANYLIPILNTSDSATNTARSLGQFFGQMATSIKEILTADKLNLMLDRMNRSIDILKGAIAPLVNAFVNLGIVGSGYFERFSEWIVKLSKQFDNFVQTNMDNGNLDRWINDAIENFKALGRAIKGAARILGALNTAAVSAGAINLGNFADALNRAADVMNGDRFQATLTVIFEGMNKAVEGVGRGLRALGPAIESAAPTISRVFGTLGDIAEKVGGLLASIISNPVLQAGVESFVNSISKSLDILAPAMKPFGDSLGGVFDLMAKILPKVAELVTAITVKWGPIFDSMGKSLAELIDPLGDALQKFVEKMTPVLQDFDTEVVKPVVKFLKEEGIPFLNKAVDQLGPALSAAFKEIGRFIREDLTPLFENLNKLLDKLKGQNINLADIFKLPDWLANPKNLMPGLNGGWLTPDGIKNGNFQKDWDNLWRPIGEWWTNTAWPGVEKWLLGELKKFEDWSNNEFGPAVRRTIDGLIKGFWGWVNDMIFGNEEPPEWKGDLFGWIGERIKKAWENDLKRLEDWWKGVKKNFQKWFKDTFGFGGTDNLDVPAKIIDGGGMGSGGATKGVSGMIPEYEDPSIGGKLETFKQKFSAAWNLLWASLNTGSSTFFSNFGTGYGGMLTSAETGTTNTTTNIGLTFATKFAEWGLGFETFKTNALVSWGIWGAETLRGTQENMGGADTTITEKTTNMAATIAGWIAVNQPAWVTAFGVMKDTTAEKMGGSNDSTTTNMASIAATITTKLQEIKNNWGPAWTGVAAGLKLAWDIMTGHTQTGVQNNADEAGKLPDKAKTAIGDTRTTLVASGAALVAGFAAGMTAPSSLGLVETAAISVAAMVAKHMPHSPAKAGPLSGLGYTTHSGRALVRDFAGGMMDNMRKVRDASAKVADAASLAGSLDIEYGTDENGVIIDRSQTILHTYNPVAEPTSRTIETAANKLRMLKG